MGGHDGGDVASAIVVEEFGRLADEGYDPARGAEVVAATLRECQRRIAEYGEQQVSGGRHQWYAGTTAVVALLVEDDEGPKWLLANLGDSRVYRFADDVLEQVSVDHSLVQELVDAGSDHRATTPRSTPSATSSPARWAARRRPRPTTSCCRCRRSSGCVLCSDGVNGMIDDDAIAAILRETDDPRDAADQLVGGRGGRRRPGQRDRRRRRCGGIGRPSTSYDSERQRESLEQKLGALP